MVESGGVGGSGSRKTLSTRVFEKHVKETSRRRGPHPNKHLMANLRVDIWWTNNPVAIMSL
jgi:hypothetical protein